MKKIILLFFMLSIMLNALSQLTATPETIDKISEIELSSNCKFYYSLEDHISNYIIKYGYDEYCKLIISMENNTINQLTKSYNKVKLNDAWYFYKTLINQKTHFIYSGNLYVLTYKPCDNLLKYSNTYKIRPNKRDLVLYRRDFDSWHEASDIIRTDYFYPTIEMVEFNPIENLNMINIGNNNVVELKFKTTYWNNQTNKHVSEITTQLFYINDDKYCLIYLK